MFKQLEAAAQGHQLPFTDVLPKIKFNSDGLVPAIAQQHDSGEVLMMAWMNAKAIEETLETKRVCYWSRSRQSFWRKGEASGNQQRLVDFRLDCDGDTVLLLVNQDGPACHSGRRNCFYNRVHNGVLEVTTDPEVDPAELYGKI